jgi:hypothetical protein
MVTKAFTQVWKYITGVPAVDMLDKQYTFVKIDNNGNIVTPAAGEGDLVVGILYDPRKADQPAQVAAHGFAFIKLGATLQAGTLVEPDDNGAAVAAGTASGGKPVGVLVVGGNAGEIGTILLK